MRTLLTLSLFAMGFSALPARANTFSLTPSSPILAGGSFDVTLNLADAFSSNPGDSITSIGFDVNVLDSSVAASRVSPPGLFSSMEPFLVRPMCS